MQAVQLRQVRKAYFGKVVLEDISLDLEHGHFYALIGQNGAGKSTLMRILNHTEAPDGGDGTVMGFKLSGDPEDFSQIVAYASEAVNLPDWGPLANFFASIRSLYPSWDQTLFQSVVDTFGLDLNASFGTLSRGQRVQACLAYVFATKPKLLLLDEVTAALDARVRALAVKLCKDFVDSGGTVIMATNIVSEVSPAADTLIYLEARRIRLVSRVSEIAEQFIKLKRPQGVNHPVFSNPECVELRIGDDSSVLYLVPTNKVAATLPDEILYPGKATAEDAFVYFTHSAQREKR